jgi:hypothetical protein
LVPAEWAGYVRWHSGGAMIPFVRPADRQLAPLRWKDYRALTSGTAAWLEIAEFQGIRYLVLRHREEAPLVALARSESRCRVLYEDRQTMLVEITAAPAHAVQSSKAQKS